MVYNIYILYLYLYLYQAQLGNGPIFGEVDSLFNIASWITVIISSIHKYVSTASLDNTKLTKYIQYDAHPNKNCQIYNP